MGVHAPLNILITFSILFHCKSDYISTLWTVNDVTGKDPWLGNPGVFTASVGGLHLERPLGNCKLKFEGSF